MISVNMGYGHQRTAYPLRHLAFEEKIINANDYQGIPEKDRKIWEKARKGYEFISRFGQIFFIGKLVFAIFDRLQRILNFYPKRDLSQLNLQLKQNYSIIKNGWGEHLIKELAPSRAEGQKPLPLITTFFTIAHMAEFFKYPGEIYCVICDTDISRTWAPLKPKSSKIKYFAPTERVVGRLKLYGVKPENVFLTGYPLPQENIGGEKMEILKEDLKNRLVNLDPRKRYFKNYQELIELKLGKLPKKSNHPLTVMFTVGGAGAQKEIGVRAVGQLRQKIKSGEIKIILAAGIRRNVKEYFVKKTKGLDVEVIFDESIEDYFQKFNQTLKRTDVLWTKPSELSFYSALGLPIIIAPPVGSQEKFNKRWLLNSGFGISQKNVDYVGQWLFDWLNQGYLAEASMEGFIEGEKSGTLNIKKIITN